VATEHWANYYDTRSRSPSVTTPGITPFLVGLFYVGCAPAALSEVALPKERWLVWSAVLVLWAVLWLVLVGTGG
jgi:hypothetical protein